MKNSNVLREDEIRPSDLMEQKRSCVEADKKFLLDRRGEWVSVPCPACGSLEQSKWGDKEGFHYSACSSCETVYTNPRPNQELVHEFYDQSQNYDFWNKYIFPATETTRRERIFRPRVERTVSILKKHGYSDVSLMEVGAAYGIFCEEAQKTGFFERILAVEPTPGLAETCRKKGFETIAKPIELIGDEVTVDVVAAFEVIEHLFCPSDFIKQCRRLINPNGLLLLTCPNVKGFDTSLLREKSGTFDHEHVNYFHPKSLGELLENCGFEVLDTLTPGLLDADLVKRKVDAGEVSFSEQPFLEEIFVKRWDELGGEFQRFLSENSLSSHLWIVAKKK